MTQDKYKELAQEIMKSEYTVVLTGAGMSTESGLSDFRSPTGIWKEFDPMKVATINALVNDYDNFHKFYTLRGKSNTTAMPHEGHYILAKWEELGLLKSVITQNVDDFHKVAGSKNVFNIHGSIREFKCFSCGKEATKAEFIDRVPCENCGGKLRPGIVLFGEALPSYELEKSIEEVKKADLVLIIGTSLTVYPAAGIHNRTSGKVVYINDVNESRKKFHMVIIGKAGEVLKKVNDEILLLNKS